MFSFFLTGALLVAAANAAYLRRPITPDGRIIGGEDATIETYPYQVSLVYKDQHFCGGSIISEKYVLTAGHCLPKYLTEDLGNIVIRAGSSIRNEGGSIHKIAFFKVHEDYYEDNRIPVNDVALIRVVQRFQFDDTRQPINLYGIRELTAAGENAVITGWGRTEHGTPEQLQTVTVPVISKELCSSAYHGLHPGQICAAYYGVGGKDTCQGDSGGPMVVGDRLAGITSWGSGCAHPKYPGVYTEVAHYREWIKSHAGL